MKTLVLLFSVVFCHSVPAIDVADVADEISRLATELFVQDANRDFRAGRFDTARKKYQLLSTRGSPAAQHGLGMIYDEGLGVTPDSKQAISWYRMAAGHGYTRSQLRLARIYLLRGALPRNRVLAYAWLYVAAAQGDEIGRRHRIDLAESMSPEQIQSARRLGRFWVRKIKSQ